VARRKLRGALEILLGTWYLRACEHGRHVRASGPVRVANRGHIRLGDRCTFIGGMIPTELACGPAASIEIGPECVFNYYVTLNARESIRIGSRAIFGSGVRILDHGRAGVAPVRIGDDVWVAHGAIIEPGVTIGRGSVVSAGTVVSADVPPDSLAIGNPVRCMSLELRSSEPSAAGTRRPPEGAVSA
jgi:maltose O-acetyltransferase